MKNHKHPPGIRGFWKKPSAGRQDVPLSSKGLSKSFHMLPDSSVRLVWKTSTTFTFQFWCQSWILLYTVDPAAFVAIKSMKIQYPSLIRLRIIKMLSQIFWAAPVTDVVQKNHQSKPPQPLGETSALQPASRKSRRQIPPPNSSTVDWSAWWSFLMADWCKW